MDLFLQDVKFAFRSLVKSPVLTTVAILSLAVGIGANSAIFSAVDVFMIRPLPFDESVDLVAVWTANRERGWSRSASSVADFLDWRDQSQTLEVAGYYNTGVNLSGGDQPERLQGLRVAYNFLDVLRVRPAMGRGFASEEERDGTPPVAIISDVLWHRSFGADPGILGRTINLDGVQHTVVGILPPRFRFDSASTDVWIPMGITGEEPRVSRFLQVLGRVRETHTLDEARAEMSRVAQRLAEAYPDANAGNSVNIIRLKDEWFDEGFRSGSLISTVAVLFVLLIACANIANLLLARGASREREIALRGALGAGKGRIVRQLLTESMMLALCGGAMGVLLSSFGIRGLVSIMPAWFPQVDQITLNGRVVAFTAVLTAVAGAVFGLAPALQSSRADLKEALSEGGRGGTSARGGRLRKGLVVSEVALAMVLLVSAGLLIQSFVQMRSADLGFQTEDVLTMRVTLPETKYPQDEDIVSFQLDLLDRLEALPAVEVAGGTHILPTTGNTGTYYWLPTDEPAALSQRPVVSFRDVIPGYFEAMGVPLISGRTIARSDVQDSPPVIVINQLFADRHWPNEDPIGRQVEFSSGVREIVGVVGVTRDSGPDDDPGPMVYFSAFQSESRSMGYTLRTSADPASLIPRLRELVTSMDPDQPVYSIQTLADMIREQIGGNTIMVKILSVLAAIALLLALVGVYGVMAYSVAQRTQEMGIRMALGAQRGDVLRLVVRQGAALAGLGVAIGVLVGLGVTRGLSFFLFGVSPFDPLTFSTVGLVLLTAGLLATYFPARRATKVDPMSALRYE
jgi:putative ABC transport system permease protein